MGAAAGLFLGEGGKPALDLVEPGGGGRGEMDMEPVDRLLAAVLNASILL